jgi:hypothetical protein
MRQLMIFTFVCLLATSAAAEETLRCGSKIVTIGMTTADVLKYCGSPSTKKTEEIDIFNGDQLVGKTQLRRWTYARGWAGKAKILEFDQDKLVKIH